MQEPKGKPAWKIRMGAIKAAIWRNESSHGPRFNVTFCRIYKDRADEQWKSSDSFGKEDLLLLAKVANAAHTWLLGQPQDRDRSGAGQES